MLELLDFLENLAQRVLPWWRAAHQQAGAGKRPPAPHQGHQRDVPGFSQAGTGGGGRGRVAQRSTCVLRPPGGPAGFPVANLANASSCFLR